MFDRMLNRSASNFFTPVPPCSLSFIPLGAVSSEQRASGSTEGRIRLMWWILFFGGWPRA